MQSFAKQLRYHATDAERLLWQDLRARRLNGFKFRRQVVIEPYIVDFACLEVKLVIEADGGQHEEQRDRGHDRTAFLQARGYRVLRFWNNEILTETQAVLEQIHRELIQSPLGFGILLRPTFCVHAVDPNPSRLCLLIRSNSCVLAVVPEGEGLKLQYLRFPQILRTRLKINVCMDFCKA